MKSLVEEATSVEKAIEKAWTRAGKPHTFSVKIFEEPQKNFFGFVTTKSAKVGIFFDERHVQQVIDDKGTKSQSVNTNLAPRPARTSEDRPQRNPRGNNRTSHPRRDRDQEPRHSQDGERRQDRPDRQERSEHKERPERTERAERTERPERNERRSFQRPSQEPAHTERPAQEPVHERAPERTERVERQDYSERTERVEHRERPERVERTERTEERSERREPREPRERRDHDNGSEREQRFDRNRRPGGNRRPSSRSREDRPSYDDAPREQKAAPVLDANAPVFEFTAPSASAGLKKNLKASSRRYSAKKDGVSTDNGSSENQ